MDQSLEKALTDVGVLVESIPNLPFETKKKTMDLVEIVRKDPTDKNIQALEIIIEYLGKVQESFSDAAAKVVADLEFERDLVLKKTSGQD